jgi:hypothetical protein
MTTENKATDGGHNPFYDGLFDGETEVDRDARLLRAANHNLAAEIDHLHKALRPFGEFESSGKLSWACVEYCVEGDPEKQTLQAPQMQRAFNRAAEAYSLATRASEAAPAQGPVAVADLPAFPTMLRKMWNGAEVQQWIDDCLKPLFQERHFSFHCDTPTPWQIGNPRISEGSEREFIVAVRRKHNEKTYVVSATFANKYDDEMIDRDGETFIADGWFTCGADMSGEVSSVYAPLLESGDEVLGWQSLPIWGVPTPDAAPVAVEDATVAYLNDMGTEQKLSFSPIAGAFEHRALVFALASQGAPNTATTVYSPEFVRNKFADYQTQILNLREELAVRVSVPDTAGDAKPAHGHRSDYFLLSNARRIVKREYQRSPNWVVAMELFGTGSSSAHQICRDAGIDPDGLKAVRADFASDADLPSQAATDAQPTGAAPDRAAIRREAFDEAAAAVEKSDVANREWIPGSLWDTLTREAASRIRAIDRVAPDAAKGESV